MSSQFDRRGMLKATAGAVAGLGLGGMRLAQARADEPAKGAPNATKLGWRLGCQAYSFNRFTFYEAVDKVHSLGLKVIEMYPGQKLSADHPDARTDGSLSPELRAEVKKKLADADVKLVNFGVCGLGTDEAANRKVFEFAKDMGIETLVAEPPQEAMKMLDKLAGEYEINVALHNHPEPSRYWNPETVIKACEGLSKRVGSCADTGHWMRSGIKPVEALRRLEGRIVSFHFKDLDRFGHSAHDVPWGTGQGNVEEMLKEIKRQGIKAVFSIEYEYNWDNSVPDMAQCVAYFDKIAAQLA
jgi:sugar phosphate isomerase/epimerase